MPAATTLQNGATRTADATAATQHAPQIVAALPNTVTPPERPASTRFSVRIETGAVRERVPISVPHVSADAAANAPANAAANAAAQGPPRVAASAQSDATPPLASTCQPLRGVPCALPVREISADGIKKANKTAAAAQPPAPKTIAPTTNAAAAPSSVSARARYASSATLAARTPPNIVCITLLQRSALRARRASPAWCSALP